MATLFFGPECNGISSSTVVTRHISGPAGLGRQSFASQALGWDIKIYGLWFACNASIFHTSLLDLELLE